MTVDTPDALPGQSHTITLSGGRLLGYAEYGDPAGTPVFSFHGWPGSRVQSARYDSDARFLGMRLIAPERPGFGLSDFQPGRTMCGWPGDIATLADRLGIERFAVLGVSGGGPYALTCAWALPSRVEAVAIGSGFGLVGEASISAVLTPSQRFAFAQVVRFRRLHRLSLELVGLIIRANTRHAIEISSRFLPECDRSILSDPWIRAISVADTREAFRNGARGAAHDGQLLTHPWGFPLAEIRQIVHLWQGDADTVVPDAMGKHLASALPNVQPRFLPGEGHYLCIPRGREMLSALRN